MISKKGIPAYITPEEAAQISRKAQTIDDIDTALSIKQAYMQLAAAENSALTDFDELKALAAVYQGGRIQGIREERAAKNERQQAGSEKATPEEVEEVKACILSLYSEKFLPEMAAGKYESDMQFIEQKFDLKRSAPFAMMTFGFYCGFMYGFEIADTLHKIKAERRANR